MYDIVNRLLSVIAHCTTLTIFNWYNGQNCQSVSFLSPGHSVYTLYVYNINWSVYEGNITTGYIDEMCMYPTKVRAQRIVFICRSPNSLQYNIIRCFLLRARGVLCANGSSRYSRRARTHGFFILLYFIGGA